MRRSIPFVLLALTGCAPLAAQTTAELVEQLAHAASLDDRFVGDDGDRSPTWRLYEQLLAKATAAELLPLTRHQSPIVRGYAVRAIVERGDRVDTKQLMLEHKDDVAEVTTHSGCCKAQEKIGDVIFATLRPQLDQEQLLDVAEALVRGNSPLYARQWALRNVRFRDGMLHDLRHRVKDGEAEAIIALSRFQLAPDLTLLIRQLQKPQPFDDNCAFLAAAIHPDPQLLPALRAILPAARQRLQGDNAHRLRFWLDAIAAQPSQAAAALLQDAFEQVPTTDYKRRDLAATFTEVLQAHPEPVFDGVLEAVAAVPKAR